MYCLIHMSEGKFTFTLCKANIPPNLLLLHWCLTSWEMVMWGKSNIFFWGASPQDIQMRQYISIHISGAVSGVFKWWEQQSEAKSWTLKLGWSHGSWFASVLCACGELRHLSGLSAQHSTFIINLPESLPPSRLSQLQLGPCDCCLSHLTLRWLALMSLSTRKSRAPSLNRAEGDYATASPRGWNNF